ncbi:MAG: hypothetical protein M3Z75_15750 [Actinomycetota bacterium]|nr:hypothetical protein [Actinomycetota bacterium]
MTSLTVNKRDDFLCHVEAAACISDGTPMAWIDWDAVIAALDGGRLPASGGEQRIAASLAAGHPVSLRDAIPGLDRQSHRRDPPCRRTVQVNPSPDSEPDVIPALMTAITASSP